MKELHRSIGRLPPLQRESLFMVVLRGKSDEQVAEATGCAVGTAKSRVFRARRQLQLWLAGETPSAAAHAQPWSEKAEADEASAMRPGRGTPDARQGWAIQVAGDAPC